MQRVCEMPLAEQAEYIMTFTGYLSNETMRKYKDKLAEQHDLRTSHQSTAVACKARLDVLEVELGSEGWKQSSQEYQEVKQRYEAAAMATNNLNTQLTNAEVFYRLVKDWNEAKQHFRTTTVRALVMTHLQEAIIAAIPEGRLFPQGVFESTGGSATRSSRSAAVANLLKYLERARDGFNKREKSKSVMDLPDSLPKFVLQDRIPRLFENIELK